MLNNSEVSWVVLITTEMYGWEELTYSPLSHLTKKGIKYKWGQVEQLAFDNIKRVMTKETLLFYPDFNKEFEIHTDASLRQIGAVISQDGKPIAFYSRH